MCSFWKQYFKFLKHKNGRYYYINFVSDIWNIELSQWNVKMAICGTSIAIQSSKIWEGKVQKRSYFRKFANIRFCRIYPFLRACEGTKNIPLLGDIFCTMHSTCIVYTLRKWGLRSCQSILCNSGITKLRHSSEMRI